MAAGQVQLQDPYLPYPWQAYLDSSTNLTYYWNPQTGSTTYQYPVAQSSAQQPPATSSVGTAPSSTTQQAAMPANIYNQTTTYSAPLPSSQPQDRRRPYNENSLDTSGTWNKGAANGNSHQAYQPPSFQQLPGLVSAEEYRKLHELSVQGNDVPAPVQAFEQAGFTSDILSEIRRAGFSSPTPIQAQCWPIAMAQRDLVGIAKTGSGKTCGFLLPGMMHIKQTNKNPRIGPTMVVLAPTRELAMQTKLEADKFGRSAGILNVCLYGGAPRGGQISELRNGVHIVIATPGRLNDFLESGKVRLSQVSYLVLDEADRMLDMGFEPQIRTILDQIPRNRQTLLFSATWPTEVKSIAAQYLPNETVHIFIGGGADGELSANPSVKQNIDIVSYQDKLPRLIGLLRQKPPGTKVIIFTATKKGADDLSANLQREFQVAAIHGDKKQQERDWVLRSFKQGRKAILVATDVAARGLDIPNVEMVINYDFPNGIEDYVHRIGRTGRAGATGEAHTFLSRDDARFSHDLIKLMEKAKQEIPSSLIQLSYSAPRSKGSSRWGSNGFYRGGGGGRYSNSRGSGFGNRSYGGSGYQRTGSSNSYGGQSNGYKSSYGTSSDRAPSTAKRFDDGASKWRQRSRSPPKGSRRYGSS